MVCACCSGIGCDPCECEEPGDEEGDCQNCYATCVVGEAEVPIDRCLSLPDETFPIDACEFTGVGTDMGVQWNESYLDTVIGCTLMLHVSFDLVNGFGEVYFRIFKCSADEWINVSSQAFVPDSDPAQAAELIDDWWCAALGGTCGDGGCGGLPECVAPP